MKKHIALILTSLILILSFMQDSIPSFAAPQDECDFLIKGIIAHEMQVSPEEVDHSLLQKWADTLLPAKVNGTGEWYVMGLSHYDATVDLSAFHSALLTFTDTDTHASYITGLKRVLAFFACNDFDSPYITSTEAQLYSGRGIMDRIFELHLVNNGLSGSDSDFSLIDAILTFRRADGGFSLSGDYGDPDVTAMVLQALAGLSQRSTDLNAVIDDALGFLSRVQEPSGDYKSYGTANPESTAQVIMALTSLGIDPLTDARFIKDGTLLDGLTKYRLEDGSFSHSYEGPTNANATVQAFYSLVALKMFYEDGHLFYKWEKKDNAPVTPIPTAVDTPIPAPSSTSTPIIPSTAMPFPQGSSDALLNFFSLHGLPMAIATFIGVFLLLLLFIFKKATGKNVIFIGIIWLILLILAAFIKITPASTSPSVGDIIFVGPGNDKSDPVGLVTISITCHTIEDCNNQFIPKDGVILPETQVYIAENTSVFQVLSALCRIHNINCDSKSVGSVYISGINNIYERDFGDLSGWMYFVNGITPQTDCGSYILQPGDIIEWKYTTNCGDDLSAR